jgi:hypothetical protein
MNTIPFDSKFTDQQERALFQQEMKAFPFRPEGAERSDSASPASGVSTDTPYSKPLAVFKSAVIGSAVVFATIAIALQIAAKLS